MASESIKNILLTGASGKLGQVLQQIWKGQTFLTPSHRDVDLCSSESLNQYLQHHNLDAVIHCAALARMRQCQAQASEAIDTNIMGTANLVKSVMASEKRQGKSIRFIHISSDGVYPGDRGSYDETSETIPSNVYGWTKLGAECSVRTLSNHCIIRTRFFDESHIPFEDSATDVFTSSLPVKDCAKIILHILEKDIQGVVNVGGERMSDYDRYKGYKPSIKKCTREKIVDELGFEIAKDVSLNCDKLKALGLDAD